MTAHGGKQEYKLFQIWAFWTLAEEDEWCWKCIISTLPAVFAVLIHVFPLPPGCGGFRKPEKWAFLQSFFAAFLLGVRAVLSLCLPPEVKTGPGNVFFLFYFPGIDLAGCVCREHRPCLPGVSPCIFFLDLAGGLRGCVLSLSGPVSVSYSPSPLALN